jgi:hypothetical protein
MAGPSVVTRPTVPSSGHRCHVAWIDEEIRLEADLPRAEEQAENEPDIGVETTAGDASTDAPSRRGIVAIARDVLLLRQEGFVHAAGREDLTTAGLAIAGGAIVVTSVAGWLYLQFDDFGAIPGGRILFREIVAGSVLMIIMWLAWLVTVESLLGRQGLEVDRRTLGRSMGFACVPLVVSLAMAIPVAAFGAALIAVAMWVMATDRAIAAAVPAASATQRSRANLAGFGLLALVMGAIGFFTGMAPGPFVFIGLWELLR